MKKKIRVLQVFASLNMGGAECRMMDVYRAIDKDNVSFDFVTLQQEKQFFENEIKQMGGKIYKLHSPREDGIRSHIRELRKCMREGNYDAVHAHTSYHCGIVMYAAKKEGIPVRITHARTNDSIRKDLKTRVYIEFGRFLINRFSTSRIAISPESGRFVFGKKQFEVIPNSIDLNDYQNIDYNTVKTLKEQFHIKDNEVIIGHVGRFDRFKNQRFVIDVFDALHKETKSRLILVGDGDMRAEMERYVVELGINDNVVFAGVRNDIPNIMNCFDVLVFPSIVEGLGGVVLEAQAAGVPSVISNNVPKIVDMNLDLVVVKSLSDSIEEWIQTIKNCSKVREKDRERIALGFDKNGFSLESSVERYLRLYKGI